MIRVITGILLDINIKCDDIHIYTVYTLPVPCTFEYFDIKSYIYNYNSIILPIT